MGRWSAEARARSGCSSYSRRRKLPPAHAIATGSSRGRPVPGGLGAGRRREKTARAARSSSPGRSGSDTPVVTKRQPAVRNNGPRSDSNSPGRPDSDRSSGSDSPACMLPGDPCHCQTPGRGGGEAGRSGAADAARRLVRGSRFSPPPPPGQPSRSRLAARPVPPATHGCPRSRGSDFRNRATPIRQIIG